MIRIVLADDHPIVLDGLESVFRTEPDFRVVARCVTGAEAISAVAEHEPDVLVTDLWMAPSDGLAIARAISRQSPGTAMVLMSGKLEDEAVIEALRLGVKGIIHKEVAPQQIVHCVRRVSAGGQWIEERFSSRVIESLLRRETTAREGGQSLTPREADVARLAADGLSNKRIADRLSIGEGTVKAHLHNAYRKLGVDNRVALALHIQRNGLVAVRSA